MSHDLINEYYVVKSHTDNTNRQIAARRLVKEATASQVSIFQAVKTQMSNWLDGVSAQPSVTLEDIMTPDLEVHRSHGK